MHMFSMSLRARANFLLFRASLEELGVNSSFLVGQSMSSDKGSGDESEQIATGILELSKGIVVDLAPRTGTNISATCY